MTSGNAFRDGAHASAVAATPASANGAVGQPRKRRRLSPPPQATIFTKAADASTALEVDHMILDYLSHQATDHVLAARKSGQVEAAASRHKLAMVDSFLEMFKAKYPHFNPDPELRFRLLLLKFTTLFCHRLVRSSVVPSKQTLGQLREENTSRARDWIRDSDGLPSGKHDMSLLDDELPLSHKALETRRAQHLRKLQAPAEDEAYEDAFYGTSASLALLDILPSFMTMIAARNDMANSAIPRVLMELVVHFMLQACLEQYLVYGASGSDAVDEAFAWGYKRPQTTDGPDDKGSVDSDASDISDEMIRMFQDEDGEPEEVPGWSDLKSQYIAMLANNPGNSLKGHLDQIAKDHAIEKFEDTLLGFLKQLMVSLPLPILVQLESGSLNGMSSAETKVFLRSCGLDAQWPKVSDLVATQSSPKDSSKHGSRCPS